MGLKVRRLKNGFAFYGEYKFGSGSGRQNCIYERVEADSLREAKKKYAARRQELLDQLQGVAHDAPAKPITVRESGASQIGAVMASLLRVLAARGAFADPELGNLLRDAFKQMDRAPSAHAAVEICNAVRGEVLQRLARSQAKQSELRGAGGETLHAPTGGQPADEASFPAGNEPH
jgi:hypothetical protein